MSEGETASLTSADALLGGRLILRQPLKGHRVGHDAILLAAAVAPRVAGAHVVDFGAGAGAVGLAVAIRLPDTRVTLVEREPALVELAQENIAANQLAARVRAVPLDITGNAAAFAAQNLPPDCADVVAMNPPFNHPLRHQASPDELRRGAHAASESTLHAWIRAALRILRSGGSLVMIWRAEELPQVLAGLDRGYGGVAVQAVHSKPSGNAIRIIVTAMKGSRAVLTLRPPLVLSDEEGRPIAQAVALLRDANALMPDGI